MQEERYGSILRPPVCHHAVTLTTTPSLATSFLYIQRLAKFDAQHNLLWARNATQLPGGSDSQPNIDNTALSPDEQYFYAVGDKDTPSTLEFGGGVTAPACADNVFRCLWVAKWRASDGVAVAAISVGGTFQDPNLGVDSQSNVRSVWGAWSFRCLLRSQGRGFSESVSCSCNSIPTSVVAGGARDCLTHPLSSHIFPCFR